jgi:hypothetical protein
MLARAIAEDAKLSVGALFIFSRESREGDKSRRVAWSHLTADVELI